MAFLVSPKHKISPPPSPSLSEQKGTANWRELATLSKKNTVTLADAGIPQITIDTFEDHMAYHEDLIRQSAEDILFAQAKPGIWSRRDKSFSFFYRK